MEFDNNKPIYIQIADNICERVLSGEFKPGIEYLRYVNGAQG